VAATYPEVQPSVDYGACFRGKTHYHRPPSPASRDEGEEENEVFFALDYFTPY